MKRYTPSEKNGILKEAKVAERRSNFRKITDLLKKKEAQINAAEKVIVEIHVKDNKVSASIHEFYN